MKPYPIPDSIALKGVSVLVVEDAWPVAKAMKGLLERQGMNVMGPAATTAEARRLLIGQGPPVAAVVDVNLKGEMAWGLIDNLHEQGVDVIVVSGYPLLRDQRGRPLNCLQKPYDATELIAALHAIVANSR